MIIEQEKSRLFKPRYNPFDRQTRNFIEELVNVGLAYHDWILRVGVFKNKKNDASASKQT